MRTVLRHRGREITEADVAFIGALIAAHSQASRRALSIELCKAWEWRQPNGALRDGVCRQLLLALHRAGHIELPSPRWRAKRPAVRSHVATDLEVDRRPLEVPLAELPPLRCASSRSAGGSTRPSSTASSPSTTTSASRGRWVST